MMKKEDRRQIRTRENIHAALLTLLKEKSLDQISITELSKMAGINRTTFYLHYRFPLDVLEEVYQNFVDELAAVYSRNFSLNANMEPTQEVWLNIYRFLAEKHETVKLLMEMDYDLFRQPFEARLLETMLLQPQYKKLKTIVPKEYYLSFLISAWTGILRRWLQNGMSECPEKMARITTAFQITMGLSNTDVPQLPLL